MKFRGKMTPSWVDESNWPSTSASSNSQTGVHHSTYHSSSRHGNVFRLLAWREISPRKNLKSRKFWEGASKLNDKCIWMKSGLFDSMNNLLSWVEAESLQHLSAKYCPLVPPPRSTIAASFSSDGKTLASTHGDHTVKIIDCQTGSCLKLLSGHRRTPWVVRFHPIHHEILASGSLDHEVRLWDANAANCIGLRDFHRPISSIAFHPQGDILAVASGHKLYIWHYNRRGETSSSPTIVLKTRRSLRAVHFHPNGAPLLLTAEVNDLDSPDCPMTLATSTGYLRYPPPTVLFMNADSGSRPSWEAKVPLMPLPCYFCPTFIKDDERALQVHSNMATNSGTDQYMPDYSSTRLPTSTSVGLQDDYGVSPMEMSPMIPLGSNHALVDTNTMDTTDSNDRQPTTSIQQRSSTEERLIDANYTLPSGFGANEVTSQASIRQSRLGIDIIHALYSSYGDSDHQSTSRNLEVGPLHQFLAFADPAYWELPFMQGWLMGQNHAALHTSTNNSLQGNSIRVQGTRASIVPSDIVSNGVNNPLTPNSGVQPRIPRRSSSQNLPHSRLMGSGRASDGSSFVNISNDETESQANVGTLETEIVTSLAAAAAAELPCTVKLRIWAHNEQNPCAPLDADTCRLVIPHAVLCSEMGAHFSPCGRFLAACIACVLPHMDVDAGLQSHMHHDVTPLSTSPTRHPISGHQIVYELRIFSLEKSTFGMVLASHAIRAAHCLTSIQFSPTSEHILLAYGRRHNSLLRSIVIDGESAIPVYTILEVYRVSDMELVRVLPSAEDEVNVACFRPLVGGGIVYGTKEGKLRLLHYDGSNGANTTGLDVFLEENALEDHLHAL